MRSEKTNAGKPACKRREGRLAGLLLATAFMAGGCGGEASLPGKFAPQGPRPAARFEALTVPEAHEVRSVTGLSGDGRVAVGTVSMPGGETQAWRWELGSAGAAVDLLPNGNYSSAAGVSADGTVVVGTGNDAPRDASDPYRRAPSEAAWRWTREGGTQALPKIPVAQFCRAAGVSADGREIVGDCSRPFRWTVSGGIERLFVGGYESAELHAISGDASTIVGSYIGLPSHEVLFLHGAYAPLPCRPPDSTYARFIALSVDGQILLGNFTGTDRRGHAALCSGAAGWQDLGSGSEQAEVSGVTATGLSNDGRRAVGTGLLARGGTAPMLWRPARGWLRLDALLAQAYETTFAGWQLASATAISGDGSTIAGMGIDPNGHPAAWRVTLPD